jgi:hypothetical protein
MKKILLILFLFAGFSAWSQGNYFGSYRYQLPKLFTIQPYSVGSTTVGGGGILLESNGCPQSSIGICCSSTRLPEWGDNVKYGTFNSPFYATFTGLTPGTYYLYRTWIYTGFEFVYGDVKTFTTGAGSGTTYPNASRNYTFYRSNCGEGYFPNAYVYNVAAGTCNELTQQLANDCADAIAAANGQSAADASGTCSMADTYSNLGRDSTVRHTGCYFSCTGTLVTYSVAANTYVNQLTQAAANALELSDLVSQIATNQGSCIRPTGLFQAMYYGNGGSYTDAYNMKYDWCHSGTFSTANVCQYSNLTVGSLVYNGTGTSCYPVADGWYYFNDDCNTTPENTLYYEIVSGVIYQIEIGPQ